MGNKWQGQVRLNNHPLISKCFVSRTDAKRWAVATETKLRRDDAGIAKIKFPLFRDVATRYINEVSQYKRCFRVERNIINVLLNETWAEYPINRITSSIISKFKSDLRKKIKENTLNRRLDVISTMFTTFKKEWGYFIENPVLAIKRPKNPEPRNRRFTDTEINLLLRGNRTNEQLREIIEIGLETGMRQSEILNIHPEHIKDQTLFIPVAKTKPRLIPLTKKALSVLKNATLPFNIDRHLLGKRFRRLCKHYRIKDAHFHDLRKQSLTNFMKDKKLNVPDTMLIAGHKDPRMLLRIYNNLQVADVAKKLN
jgi:integrase